MRLMRLRQHPDQESCRTRPQKVVPHLEFALLALRVIAELIAKGDPYWTRFEEVGAAVDGLHRH
jgi:hypothetical protein